MSKKSLLYLGILLSCIAGGFYYFYSPKRGFAKIPVYYLDSTDLPMISISIESKKYAVALDTGAQHYLALQERCFQQIADKTEAGTRTFYSLRGDQYSQPSFKIPRIEIENFKAYPIMALEENVEYLRKGGYIIAPPDDEIDRELRDMDGRLGSYLFSSFCLFLDLPHSVMYIARDQEALRNEVSFEGFVEVPLCSGDWPVVEVKTERGVQKILLDSGCSVSLWRNHEDEQLKTFEQTLCFNDVDFGKHTFRTFALDTHSDIDAILGLDFLKKHTVFIDIKNQRALISAKNDNL